MKKHVILAALIFAVSMFACGNVYADEITGKIVSLSPVSGQPGDHWKITIESNTGVQVMMRTEYWRETLQEKLTSASLLMAYANNHDVVITYHFSDYFWDNYMENIKLIK